MSRKRILPFSPRPRGADDFQFPYFSGTESEDELSTPAKRPKSHLTRTFQAESIPRHGSLGSQDLDTTLPQATSRQPGGFKGIRVSNLTHPKSLYNGWKSSLPITSESKAIQVLMAEKETEMINDQATNPNGAAREVNHTEFDLTDFTIYKPAIDSPNAGWLKHTGDFEMVPLHALMTKVRCERLLLNGTLSVGHERCYVQALPFDILSIGGYDDLKCHSVSGMWIQTTEGKANLVWYRLRQPAQEYLRYHEPFCWVADFGKHFTDYLLRHQHAELKDFRVHFHAWAVQHHSSSTHFQCWLKEFGSSDFRVAVAAYYEYLWKETTSVDEDLRTRPIWGEIDHRALHAVRPQTSYLSGTQRTIVTPFVFGCFKNLYFAKVLEPKKYTSQTILNSHQARKKALGFYTSPYSPSSLVTSPQHHPPKLIQRGHVVSVLRDLKIEWEDKAETWLAYVRDIHEDKKGKYLEVTWLYRPEDTILSSMTYPYGNELFFSNNCNCGDRSFRISDVKSMVTVEWTPTEAPQSDYFVRQKYCVNNHDFRTFKEADFVCNCSSNTTAPIKLAQCKYQIQDTVLIEQWRDNHIILEPFIITDFLPKRVQVRRLLRAKRDCGKIEARPNELVWTDQLMEFAPGSIHRNCHIRFFRNEDVIIGTIISPYNRDGQADFYYITSRLLPHREQKDIQALRTPFPGPMRLGIVPREIDRPKMRMLSLFSGGGNFDRGLEEGGAIETRWSVEWDGNAVHSYRANLTETKNTQIFYGSVNDAMVSAIDGANTACVPKIGQVDGIIGGSPCEGFSLMQPNRLSLQSLTNASKVASLAAFIDHYRPAYALLENVVSMSKKCGPKKEQNVFSQMLCSLVAMGYQVKHFIWDAWSSGAPQSRTRLFISVAAPGLEPMPPLRPTHAHPDRQMGRALGKTSNGRRFGVRQFQATPFSFQSAEEATRDLPSVEDGQVGTCIPFPDHRCPVYIRPLLRYAIHQIPKWPRSQNLVKAAEHGILPTPLLDHIAGQGSIRKSNKSKAFTRINPDGMFPTVLTKLTPACGISGTTVHWADNRIQTVMEARRAQGYLDHEVLIGTPSAQWKIVGNSVPRHTALTLGMSLREAWLANSERTVQRIMMSNIIPRQHPISPQRTSSQFHSSSPTSGLAILAKETLNKWQYEDWTGFAPDVSVDRGDILSKDNNMQVADEKSQGFVHGAHSTIYEITDVAMNEVNTNKLPTVRDPFSCPERALKVNVNRNKADTTTTAIQRNTYKSVTRDDIAPKISNKDASIEDLQSPSSTGHCQTKCKPKRVMHRPNLGSRWVDKMSNDSDQDSVLVSTHTKMILLIDLTRN